MEYYISLDPADSVEQIGISCDDANWLIETKTVSITVIYTCGKSGK